MMPSVHDRYSRQEVLLSRSSQSLVRPVKRSQTWLARSKNLDLALLAGCSCLLTLLYHPVSHAFASNTGAASTTTSAGSTASTAALVTSGQHNGTPLQLTTPQRKLDAKQDLESEEE